MPLSILYFTRYSLSNTAGRGTLSVRDALPTASLPCQWEWTVGGALIGREPESHLHLGQAALALNPYAPPFLPPPTRQPVSLSACCGVLLRNPHSQLLMYGEAGKHTSNPSKTELVSTKKARTVKNTHLQGKWDWTFHDLILQIKAERAARLKSAFDGFFVFFPPDHAVPVLLLSVLDTVPLATKSVITPLLMGNFYNHFFSCNVYLPDDQW